MIGRYRPDIIDLIKTDQQLFFITTLTLIFFSSATIIFVSKHYPFVSLSADDYLEMVFIPIATCIGIPYAWYRIRRIRRLFEIGEELNAKITYIEDVLSPWFGVQYEYEYYGIKKKALHVLMCTSCTRKLIDRNEVDILYDPKSRWSYIVNAFTCEKLASGKI